MDGLAASPLDRSLRAGAGSSTCSPSPFHAYAVGLSPLEPDQPYGWSPGGSRTVGSRTVTAADEPRTGLMRIHELPSQSELDGEPRMGLTIRELPSQSELDVADSANRRAELPSQLHARERRARQLTFAQNPAPSKKPSPLASATAAATTTGPQDPSGPEATSAAASVEVKRCNCRKSQCLKLYCECFSAAKLCSDCSCVGCLNGAQHGAEREDARRATLQRNPTAFKPKILQATEAEAASTAGHHLRGCFCKKSGCLKKYCECFEAGATCCENCKCEKCHNREDADGFEEAHTKRRRRLRNSLGSATNARRLSLASSIYDDEPRTELLDEWTDGDGHCEDYRPHETPPIAHGDYLTRELDGPSRSLDATPPGGTPLLPRACVDDDALASQAWGDLRACHYAQCGPTAGFSMAAGFSEEQVHHSQQGLAAAEILGPGMYKILVPSAPSCAEQAALHSLNSALRFSKG